MHFEEIPYGFSSILRYLEIKSKFKSKTRKFKFHRKYIHKKVQIYTYIKIGTHSCNP